MASPAARAPLPLLRRALQPSTTEASADALADALSSLTVAAPQVARTPTAAAPRHLLVLDVNGLLLDRQRSRVEGAPPPDLEYGSASLRSYVYDRPHAREFVAWALQRFRVAVWSSARSQNLAPLVQHVFGDGARALAFVWAQDRCGVDGSVELTGRRGGRKPKFLKPLAAVWDAGLGEPHATLLVDDDRYKAARNPAHTAVHPAPYTVAQRGSDAALADGGALRRLLARMADAESVPAFIAVNAADVEALAAPPT